MYGVCKCVCLCVFMCVLLSGKEITDDKEMSENSFGPSVCLYLLQATIFLQLLLLLLLHWKKKPNSTDQEHSSYSIVDSKLHKVGERESDAKERERVVRNAFSRKR